MVKTTNQKCSAILSGTCSESLMNRNHAAFQFKVDDVCHFLAWIQIKLQWVFLVIANPHIIGFDFYHAAVHQNYYISIISYYRKIISYHIVKNIISYIISSFYPIIS